MGQGSIGSIVVCQGSIGSIIVGQHGSIDSIIVGQGSIGNNLVGQPRFYPWHIPLQNSF